MSRDRRLGLMVFTAVIVPALAAVWLVPGFVTQDGPAHLYNARILLDSLGPDSPYAAAYTVRWRPLPNWAGHLSLVALMAVGASPWVADRVVLSLTLVGLAGAILWLRRQVAGWQGMPMAALLAVLLALNVTWLLGFSSFLLGACLFPIALGLWWDGRQRPGPARAALIAGLLVASYFAHVVALGLTATGLVVLAATTPGPAPLRRRRALWTLASLLPLVPLGLLYRAIMRGGGAIEPLWMELADPWSLASWWTRLVWVDPLTLGSKRAAPFVEGRRAEYALLTPVLWATLGLLALVASTARRALARMPEAADSVARRERRGWAILATLLIVGGFLGPDTLGERHGNYLSQRVVLLGLVALVPWLDGRLDRRLSRFGAAALGVAVVLQSAFLWDYALRSDRDVSVFLRAGRHVGRGERVAALMLDQAPGYRADPLRHLGTLLGVETGAVVWSNYEAAHYYFPVQPRAGAAHPPVLAFEEISIHSGPESAAMRAEAWADLLARHHGSIDLLVIRGEDPGGLDPITARWYAPVAREGPVRILRRRPIEHDPVAEGRAGHSRPARMVHFQQ